MTPQPHADRSIRQDSSVGVNTTTINELTKRTTEPLRAVTRGDLP
jgi:hypothetical protein